MLFRSVPESWSPKGDRFLFSATKDSKVTLWTFSLQDKKAVAFGGVQSAIPTNAAFSPDSRWVAYQASENAASSQIYVQPYPTTGATYQITKRESGVRAQPHSPFWSPDGKQLFYVPGQNRFVVVGVNTQPGLTFGNPVEVPRGGFLGSGQASQRTIDVMPDGRILARVPAGQMQSRTSAAPQIQVVLNWTEELKQRVPTR